MSFSVAAIFYLLPGFAVAPAVFLSAKGTGAADRLFQTATAIPFWPFYLAVLLARGDQNAPLPADPRTASGPLPSDPILAALRGIEEDLSAALEGLQGAAGDVLAKEKGRISELRRAWRAHAERLRSLDGILGGEEAVDPALAAFETSTSDPKGKDRLQAALDARRENREKLRAIRRRTETELLESIARVRELVSMLQLVRFAGAPGERTQALLESIARAVEGLSAVENVP